jgi:hypothetical protein
MFYGLLSHVTLVHKENKSTGIFILLYYIRKILLFYEYFKTKSPSAKLPKGLDLASSPGRIRTYNPPVNSRMLHR